MVGRLQTGQPLAGRASLPARTVQRPRMSAIAVRLPKAASPLSAKMRHQQFAFILPARRRFQLRAASPHAKPLRLFRFQKEVLNSKVPSVGENRSERERNTKSRAHGSTKVLPELPKFRGLSSRLSRSGEFWFQRRWRATQSARTSLFMRIPCKQGKIQGFLRNSLHFGGFATEIDAGFQVIINVIP